MGEYRAALGTSTRPRTLLLSLAAITLLTTSACSHENPPALGQQDNAGVAEAPASTPPANGSPDAQHVCTQFVTLALSVNGVTDAGPGDARARAAERYGIAGLAEQIGGEGRDNIWKQLVAHRAHVQVTTQPVVDDTPPVRDNETGAGVTASRIALGANGWRQDLTSLVAYCSLRRIDEGWKISGLTLSDTSSHGIGQ